jgi:hypothetical protein
MDGTTSAVNYLLSPMPNDYYDHHAIQPTQSLGNLSYYQSDAIDCFYEHNKSDFQSSTSYVYHPIQQQQRQPVQTSFIYDPTSYDLHPMQGFVQEPACLILSNQTRLSSMYESASSQMPSTFLSDNGMLKQEAEDVLATTGTSSTVVSTEKSQVYDWMKGMLELDVFISIQSISTQRFQAIKFEGNIDKSIHVIKHSN